MTKAIYFLFILPLCVTAALSPFILMIGAFGLLQEPVFVVAIALVSILLTVYLANK